MRTAHPTHPQGECAQCDHRRDTQRRAMAAKRAAERPQEPRFYPPPIGLPKPITDPDDWRLAALCAQVDADLWHPDKGESAAPARRICRTCPVQADCLTHALETGEGHGVWGGYSPRERRAIARRRAA